jgi:chitin synthase
MFFLHIQAAVSYSLATSNSIMLTTIQYNIFSLIFSWFSLANIWLTFSIIIDLVADQDPFFGTQTVVRMLLYCAAGRALLTYLQTHWINLALKWIYLAFLALQVSGIKRLWCLNFDPYVQFVLALGNRPKGERMAYALTLWYARIV